MSTVKKYQHILQDIKQKIEEKTLKNGDQLPKEELLCKTYHASRMTVHKALNILAIDGYIKRIPGKGSYVNPSRIVKNMGSICSFTKDMEAVGLKASSKLIEYRVFRAHDLPELAKKMKLKTDDFIYYFVRLRLGDDLPIALSYTYISSEFVPALDVEKLKSSLYEYLQSLGLSLSYGEGAMTAVMPSEDQKQMMNIGDTAFLKNAHSSYVANHKMLEFTETFYIGSRYTYQYDFEAKHK